MRELKRRIAILLCFVLTIPTMLGILPQAKLETQAASEYTCDWLYFVSSLNDQPPVLQVNKGVSDFYIGDFINYYSKDDCSRFLSTNEWGDL